MYKYYQGNGKKIITIDDYMVHQHSWQRVNHYEDADFLWKINANQKVFDTLTGDQIINIYPNSEILTNKMEASFYLRKFIPTSEIVYNGKPRRCQSEYVIVKPFTSFGGQGIEIVKNDECYVDTPCVVQEFIKYPRLFEGRKYDLRTYVLLKEDYSIYTFEKSFIRTATNLHSSTDLSPQTQITNITINPEGIRTVIDTPDELILKNTDVFNSVKNELTGFDIDCHYFQCFGVDYIQDVKGKYWLIEVNQNPGIIKEIKPKLINDLLNLTVNEYFPLVNFSSKLGFVESHRQN